MRKVIWGARRRLRQGEVYKLKESAGGDGPVYYAPGISEARSMARYFSMLDTSGAVLVWIGRDLGASKQIKFPFAR